MSLSYEMFSLATGADYYESVIGYQIPPKLQGSIPFEKTEELASFYLARHEGAGRLLWFAKILVEVQNVRTWAMAEARAPGSSIFVEAVVGSEGFELAHPICYSETNGQAMYFQVEVGADGCTGSAQLLCRKVAFADFYTYGPGGRLRRRKLVKNDEGYSVWEYDNSGNIGDALTAATDGISPAEWELLRGPNARGVDPTSKLDHNIRSLK